MGQTWVHDGVGGWTGGQQSGRGMWPHHCVVWVAGDLAKGPERLCLLQPQPRQGQEGREGKTGQTSPPLFALGKNNPQSSLFLLFSPPTRLLSSRPLPSLLPGPLPPCPLELEPVGPESLGRSSILNSTPVCNVCCPVGGEGGGEETSRGQLDWRGPGAMGEPSLVAFPPVEDTDRIQASFKILPFCRWTY